MNNVLNIVGLLPVGTLISSRGILRARGLGTNNFLLIEEYKPLLIIQHDVQYGNNLEVYCLIMYDGMLCGIRPWTLVNVL